MRTQPVVGERIHLAGPLVNLSTHVRDVVNHVLYEDLDQIVLLGFSYGGFVVTGALEHIAESGQAPRVSGRVRAAERRNGIEPHARRGKDEDRARGRLAGDRTSTRIRRPRRSRMDDGSTNYASQGLLHRTRLSLTTSRGIRFH